MIYLYLDTSVRGLFKKKYSPADLMHGPTSKSDHSAGMGRVRNSSSPEPLKAIGCLVGSSWIILGFDSWEYNLHFLPCSLRVKFEPWIWRWSSQLKPSHFKLPNRSSRARAWLSSSTSRVAWFESKTRPTPSTTYLHSIPVQTPFKTNSSLWTCIISWQLQLNFVTSWPTFYITLGLAFLQVNRILIEYSRHIKKIEVINVCSMTPEQFWFKIKQKVKENKTKMNT